MSDSFDLKSTEFTDQVKGLEPWWFEFRIADRAFGGSVPRDTEKTELFWSWVQRLGGGVETILELGSHEGSHTLQLAKYPSVKKVIGLEGREDNLARANFIKQIYQCDNVEFCQENLEKFDPRRWQQNDAVFCAGLLYHLPQPWELVRKLPFVCSRYLFLDTHYAGTEEVLVERYSGQWCSEGTDPLSGLSTQSFWLSFKDLVLLLMENGFLIRFVRDYEGFPKGPRAFLFAEKKAEAVGCDWSNVQKGAWSA